MYGCQQVLVFQNPELRVINHCLENKIGRIVFSWNKGSKKQIELAKKSNSEFVPIPTARLKERIAQLCEVYQVIFIETEETYTSIASFLDGNNLPIYGEKPHDWKLLGKRIKRGLYRTGNNWDLNADCNGTANMIKKVSRKLGLDLSRLFRGILRSPQRIYSIFRANDVQGFMVKIS